MREGGSEETGSGEVMGWFQHSCAHSGKQQLPRGRDGVRGVEGGELAGEAMLSSRDMLQGEGFGRVYVITL